MEGDTGRSREIYREDEGGVEDGGERQDVREAVERLGEGEGDGGAREQQARRDELRLGGAAAVEGECGERVGGDHAVEHQDLLLLHGGDQRAVALVRVGVRVRLS